MNYPYNFLKGLSDKNKLTPDRDGVSASVFYFEWDDVRARWSEQSICWEDDADVVSFVMGQKKDDGEIQFRAGLARVARSCVELINKVPRTKDLLSYERQALENNPYHGNLLLKENTHKYIMKIAGAQIAGYAEVINRE